jgi:hypothetical protein
MRDTLNASKAAADAARDTASYLSNIERAYVFTKVETDERHGGPNQTYIWKLRALFINYGKTPANILSVSGAWIPIKPGGIRNITVPDQRTYPDGLVIASGKNWNLPISVEITESQSEEIQKGQLILYCCGFIRYKDIFDKGWETGYCWEYVVRNKRFSFSASVPHLNYCREYHPEDVPNPNAPRHRVSNAT